MATEEMIKGKRCRYYTNGYIWVSEDGTVVAIKQKSGYWKYFDIKTDGNGEKFVNTGYITIYIKKAVFTCFCYCDDPNKTQTLSCCQEIFGPSILINSLSNPFFTKTSSK